MGNKTSTANGSDRTVFKTRINTIAARFILGRKFNELKQLVSEKYCNDLMILTKDVLADNFTTDEIKYLATGSSDSAATTKETVMYISKRDLANIETGTRNKKLSMCKGIAKFYVRLAHLFAAIATTVSPNWEMASNATAAPGALEQPPMPQPPLRGGQVDANNNSSGSGSRSRSTDFCSVRIRALLGATKLQNNTVFVQPSVCSVYASNDNPLLNQPGMPDLEYLYNDIYDYDTGKFTGRSIAMQALYASNVKTLYTEFTGNTDVPDNIKTFGDININSLARYSECGKPVQTPKPAPVKRDDADRYRERDRDRGWDPRYRNENYERDRLESEKDLIKQDSNNIETYYKMKNKNYSGTFNSQFSVSKNNGAYSNYGAHIKQMIDNANRARANLMQVIDKLFLIVESETSGKKNPVITVHPKLTYEMLDTLINQTRELIIKLYVGCERDFYTGMSLLHVIIEEIMNANLTAQLEDLKMDTRKKIETLHQSAARASIRNGSSRSAYVPELLSSEDTQAIYNYETADDDDRARAPLIEETQINTAENAKIGLAADVDDAPVVAASSAPAAPVVATSSSAPAIPVVAAPAADPVVAASSSSSSAPAAAPAASSSSSSAPAASSSSSSASAAPVVAASAAPAASSSGKKVSFGE